MAVYTTGGGNLVRMRLAGHYESLFSVLGLADVGAQHRSVIGGPGCSRISKNRVILVAWQGNYDDLPAGHTRQHGSEAVKLCESSYDP